MFPFLSRYRPLSREDIPQLFGRQIQPFLHIILVLRISYNISRLFIFPCAVAADDGGNIQKKSYRFFPSSIFKVWKMNDITSLETVTKLNTRPQPSINKSYQVFPDVLLSPKLSERYVLCYHLQISVITVATPFKRERKGNFLVHDPQNLPISFPLTSILHEVIPSVTHEDILAWWSHAQCHAACRPDAHPFWSLCQKIPPFTCHLTITWPALPDAVIPCRISRGWPSRIGSPIRQLAGWATLEHPK